MDEHGEREVWTYCAVNCGSMCALRCRVRDGKIVHVGTDEGPAGPAPNPGFASDRPRLRACPRGRAIAAWLQSPERLDYPLRRVPGTRRGEGRFERISWDEALDIVARELTRVRATYGDAAVYRSYATGVEDGVIGAKPVERLLNLTGGHLGYYGSYSSAQIEAAGEYTYGGGTHGSSFSSIVDGELVVMFGNSPAETRMGGASQARDLVRACRGRGVRLVCIDPRMSDTVRSLGGEWIPVLPGTDGALVCALAYEIIANGWADEAFLHRCCVGYDEQTLPECARGRHASYKDYILGLGPDGLAKTPAWAAPICGVPVRRIVDLARELHEADPVFICQGYGLERHANGEMAARDVMVLPQLLGQVGRPGTSDGRREKSRHVRLGTMPVGENPVKAKISCFNWPDAIDHGPEMTALNAGVRGVGRLDSGIKFIFNYAGNCLTNQHADVNGTHDLLADDTKCEFIVTSEVFMTDSARYSDIVLPDLTSQEQLGIAAGGYADHVEAVVFGRPVCAPKAERRGIYEVCADLARRLGVGEAFTEGKTREGWLRQVYEEARARDARLPTWDEGFAAGVWACRPEPVVALAEFVEDPAAHPLPTPSGKIEIYSERLARLRDTWELGPGEVIHPLPVFDPGLDSYRDLTEEYPLLVVGFQSKVRVHSSYANNPVLAAARDAVCAWVNPADAAPRGVADGDEVRVFNDLGELRIQARVTERVMPGVVAIPEGAWYEADAGEGCAAGGAGRAGGVGCWKGPRDAQGRPVDVGGCINTITRYRPSPLAKGNPQHSNVGQVAKVN